MAHRERPGHVRRALDGCELATLGAEGTVERTDLAAIGSDLEWSVECRILDGASGPVAVSGITDLTSSADHPPVGLFAAPFTRRRARVDTRQRRTDRERYLETIWQ